MTERLVHTSRRDFVGRLASSVALGACVMPASASALTTIAAEHGANSGEWDLSWTNKLATATDRAVFDMPTISDGSMLDIAARYLDNCEAAYAPRKYEARAVLNIRTQAVAMALTDEAWERFSLGAEYSANDPVTQKPAIRNPHWHHAPGVAPTSTTPLQPTVDDLVQRGAIVLVCDFALGHLSKRVGTKLKREADDIHRELRASFVPGAYAVPSGIFGLAKAQNAGCAYVRM